MSASLTCTCTCKDVSYTVVYYWVVQKFAERVYITMAGIEGALSKRLSELSVKDLRPQVEFFPTA